MKGILSVLKNFYLCLRFGLNIPLRAYRTIWPPLGYDKSSVIHLHARLGSPDLTVELMFRDADGVWWEQAAALRTQLGYSLLVDEFAAKLGFKREPSDVSQVQALLSDFEIKGVYREVYFGLPGKVYKTDFYAVESNPRFAVALGGHHMLQMGAYLDITLAGREGRTGVIERMWAAITSLSGMLRKG
jgi:hypothetical protein